ncbi:hypothetical protein MODO_3731 [Myroides odoratimimus]|uniref:DUF3800 domain-containing protein n=1 Tax=Myroides odoratimimus CCUG 10230 TaxID=883150 RepID=A0ABN0E8D0_9FLAO|nr:hypothetical protein [Myroides odoratimimus]EHO07777.1 hypothetical protein HMPREF9712_02513 [Myroides odoratimimus CCUG 10230]GAQ16026.1 hypothetical protein MODO_3731 [Myroides odoratimimus]STZ48018.1 Uncharacterised protein [Myroides odoratimimus]
MKKKNYFYIDEAGHISNDSPVFIHGCVKTDSPEALLESINKIKDEILNDDYFIEDIDIITQQGFHATENHPDVRKHYYAQLHYFNFRAYFVVLNKKSDFFKQLKQQKSEFEIFEISLKKLLRDRIEEHKLDKNIFYFENIEIAKKSLKNIVKDIFESFDKNLDIEYHIVGKEVINLSVIDYLNYILFNILKSDKKNERMEKNFNLISPKIGIINILHNNVFLGRKKQNEKRINILNLKREYSG